MRDFNNIEMQAVIKFVFLRDMAPKEIHAILTEILACFLPDRAKDLSAPLYVTSVTSLFIKMFKDALGCKNVVLLHINERNVSTDYVAFFRG